MKLILANHPRGHANRWRGLLMLVLWGSGVALWCATPIPRPLIKNSAYGRPNVVLFLAEGLSYADLPPYGATNRFMPHWAQLAAEGMRFDCAYGAGPYPELTLRELLTGQDGMENKTAAPSPAQALTARPVLPLLLREQGYVTGMLGWWPPGESWPPMAQGFDEWFGSFEREALQQVYPRYLHRNQIRHEFNPPATPQRFAAPQLLVTAITNFVRTSRLYPFFLQVIYPSPPTNASRQEWLQRWDRDLGTLLAALRYQRVETQTVVIAGGLVAPRLTSSAVQPLPSPMGLLRCSTNGVYEGDLRMPLLLRWPARLSGGVTNRQPITLPELHATLAAWGDVPLPPETRQLSQADSLLSASGTNVPPRGRWQNPQTGAEALRDGPWKLVRPHRQSPWELYHLDKDPGERENLAAQRPEEVKRMETLWQKQRMANTP